MSEIKCSQCGNVFYSKKSSLTTHTARCPDCNKVNIAYGSGDKKKSAGGGAMIIIFLAIIGILAFGSIGLTYFARKKSWHWISYLGSLIIAVGSIYVVSENFEPDWLFGVVVFCNLFGILYAFYSLLKKWFKWAVLVCVLLGIGVSLWPDPEPIVYYEKNNHGNIDSRVEYECYESKINVFRVHSSLNEVVVRNKLEKIDTEMHHLEFQEKFQNKEFLPMHLVEAFNVSDEKTQSIKEFFLDKWMREYYLPGAHVIRDSDGFKIKYENSETGSYKLFSETGFPTREQAWEHAALACKTIQGLDSVNIVTADDILVIDSIQYGWCHIHVQENPEVHGWVYEQEITEK